MATYISDIDRQRLDVGPRHVPDGLLVLGRSADNVDDIAAALEVESERLRDGQNGRGGDDHDLAAGAVLGPECSPDFAGGHGPADVAIREAAGKQGGQGDQHAVP